MIERLRSARQRDRRPTIGLEQYTATFIDNAIDVAILPDLTEADLEKLGVVLGHRKRMLKALAELSAGSPAPAAPVGSPVPASEGERRQITVLFCDLVDFDPRLEQSQLDPEDSQAPVIRRFQATCAGIIKQAGGNIAKRYMGDGLLAYFGYPQAHEDDAECAVRAGLDLVAKVGQLLLPSNEPLQIQVGIATGLVIVGETIGEGSSREQAVVGETPNLASRLQSLAPRTLLLSLRTLIGSLVMSSFASIWDHMSSREFPSLPRFGGSPASERSKAASRRCGPASSPSSSAGRPSSVNY